MLIKEGNKKIGVIAMIKELEVGKRYKWVDAVKTYPGKWVRMSDCTMDHAEVVDGIFLGVYSDEESEKVELEMIENKSKDILDRTTSDMAIGVIDCLNAKMC